MIGNETRVKVVKTRCRHRSGEAQFDIPYGEGISREGEIIELGVTHKIVEKSGAWYSYNGQKIGQGKDNSREYLRKTRTLPRKSVAVRDAVGVNSPVANFNESDDAGDEPGFDELLIQSPYCARQCGCWSDASIRVMSYIPA